MMHRFTGVPPEQSGAPRIAELPRSRSQHRRCAPKRMRHAMVYDSLRAMTVLFGGVTGNTYTELNDTWGWNGGGAAASTNYGAGWPGTSGVPSLTASSDPVLCAPIMVDVANSRGAS